MTLNDILDILGKQGNCHYRLSPEKPGEVVIEQDPGKNTMRVVIITPKEDTCQKGMDFSAFYYKKDVREMVPFICHHDEFQMFQFMSRVVLASDIERIFMRLDALATDLFKRSYSHRMLALVVDEGDDPFYTPDPSVCYDREDLAMDKRPCDVISILDIDVPRRAVALFRYKDESMFGLGQYSLSDALAPPTLYLTQNLQFLHSSYVELASIMTTIAGMIENTPEDRYVYVPEEYARYHSSVRRGVRIKPANKGSYWNMNLVDPRSNPSFIDIPFKSIYKDHSQ